jgi:iron complex transport system substrate-binding protein
MAQRIVSLVPGATELICELGLRGRLVGRSERCDYPASVLRLPALTDASIPPQHLKSAAARPAQNIVQHYLATSTVLVERLIELQPDFIVTQFNAAAPGFNVDELKRALNSLIILRPQVLTFAATTLAEVHTEIQKIADAFGVGQKGKALVARHRKRIDQITEKARSAAKHPSVLCLSHLEPLHAAGYWVPSLIEAAGGIPLVSRVGQAPALLTWEQIAALDPDVLILALEGLSADEHCPR